MPTNLHRLHADFDQSPWLDNLTRGSLRDGTLARMVSDGIRGVTANPTILANAIARTDAYDEQFLSLIDAGCSVEDAYWDLVVTDITSALAVMRPVFDAAVGDDGFVSLEVGPELARDTDATVTAARNLHRRINEPNLLVKIPATPEGIPAIEQMIAAGYSINVTLIFSLTRYAQVVEAYLRGLEAFSAGGGDPSTVNSVASFFVSRVDSEVDAQLDSIGGPEAHLLQGQAAVAQAKVAYHLFREQFSTERWAHLAALGARPQRPLWASTSTKNPAYPDTLYVDSLIGPRTVNTLPEATIADFEDHGSLARTIDIDIRGADAVLDGLAGLGIDLDDIGITLEDQGIAAFEQSFQEVLAVLAATAEQHQD